MRRMLMVANWKMNKSIAETRAFCQEFMPLVNNIRNIDMVICPPFTSLQVLKSELESSIVKLGAQNLFGEENGAYTGEISASMLTDVGCCYVIIGHSERRRIMGEDDGLINRKVKAALSAGLIPILCVGETLQQREKSIAEEVVENQIFSCLENISLKEGELVIAYEPVWAIGSGKAATTEDAEGAAAYILSLLADQFGAAAEQVRVQYGGSVKAENIGSFVSLPSVSGALIGGASLEAASFAALIEAARKAVNS